MAPHSLIDLSDTSDYSPSMTSFTEILLNRAGFKSLTSRPVQNVLDSQGLRYRYKAKQHHDSFFWHLSNDEVKVIERNIESFKSSNLPLFAVNAATFPLDQSLRSKLKDVLATIYGQQQFLVVSGLDPFRYTDIENVILHAGLSCHIGSIRGMPGKEGGDNAVLHHITALPAGNNSPEDYHGPPNQSRDIPFHTDNGDIVSLYMLSQSETGGAFYLAYVNEVYNELAILEPQLAQILTDDWTIISPSSTRPYDTRPLAFIDRANNNNSNHVKVNCSRARITGTPSRPRPNSLPALTEVHKRALDGLHTVAMARAIKLQLRPGDMVFFNNLGMLHARDAFVDNEAAGRKRHLLRLILRDEEAAWSLPVQLEGVWEALYRHEVQEEVFPVEKELFSFATSH